MRSFQILSQPNDTTCGPTCLHAVYEYFGDRRPLSQVIAEIPPLPGGGTLAVWLACDALMRGYDATIYTYNLHLFDPTWFVGSARLADRLRAQAKLKPDAKLQAATHAYLKFLTLGGELRFEAMSPAFIEELLSDGQPVLTGLSATYLYQCSRERDDEYDDIGGEPTGHFVVLHGFDPQTREVHVADPLHDNPGFHSSAYSVGVDRLIASALLGIVTYDANLLVITPRPPSDSFTP